MILTETITFSSSPYWYHKHNGGVFVTKPEHIEPVYEALCEQDEYWESYRELIQVMPENAKMSDLLRMIEYVGKTDIENVPKFIEKMEAKGIDIFIINQPADI